MTARRPEEDLLLCCGRAETDAATAERLRSLLRQAIDWPYLLRIARRHGMVPLVYWHLSAVSSEAVPRTALDELRAVFDANARRNLHLTGELIRLLHAFDAGGVAALPYKGPTLASSVYGNLALRQFCDLDILVRPRDVPKAEDLLISRGYRPRFSLSPVRQAALLRFQHEHPFDGSGGCLVDLHWAIAPKLFAFPLDLDELWERLETVPLAGRRVPSLSAEDLLLILCAHGSRHFWRRLEWVCDVAGLIRVSPEMDWGALMDRAARLGSVRMLLLGLSLASRLLGAVLPANVRHRIQADRELEALAAYVREGLFPRAGDRPQLLREAAFLLRARERLRDRVRLAMTPSGDDWAPLPLPVFLSFVYYLVRPIRLARKYGLRLLPNLL